MISWLASKLFVQLIERCSWGFGLVVASTMVTALNSSIHAQEDGVAAMAEQAIDEYDRAMELDDRDARIDAFRRAEQLFRQVVAANDAEGRSVSAACWVALGNAALQAAHTGHAIVAFRNAIRLEPGHSQAMQNLSYARSMLPEWIRYAPQQNLADTLFFWQATVSRPMQRIVTAVLFLIATCLMSVAMRPGWGRARYLAAVFFAVWVVGVISLFVGRRTSDDHTVVVVAEETILRSADSASSPARLNQPLPDGAELTLLRSRGDWSEIEVNGRTGWVLNSSISFEDVPEAE